MVVIDEYPYLADSVPGFSTLLQRVWDAVLQHTKPFLCLSGSAYSVMRREILDGAAPLYQRHTWAYELPPLQPSDLRAFFPTLTAEQLIETYAVLGGMPRNLLAYDPQRSLMRNIEQEILDPAGNLFSEVRRLLHEELKGEVEPSAASWRRLLRAITDARRLRRSSI